MTLRAGLVGAGSMGRNHARVLRGLDGVDLVGVADPAGEGAHDVVVDDVTQLVDLGIDYAVVACPTRHHESVGLALAEAGVHALIEKPLAATAEAAARLAAAFADRGLVAGVGHIERYNPALLGLRERLEAGELGEIYQIATRRQGPFPHRIDDVGVVKDLATHDIDLTAWVTGRGYRSVSARTVTKSGRPHEDMVAVVGDLEGGLVSDHLVNWLSPFKERLTVVTGTAGCFVADTLQASLHFYKNGEVDDEWEALRVFRGVSEGDATRYALRRREPLQVEHEAFRDAVLGRDASIVTLAEGTHVVQVAEAILQSAASGETIQVTVT
jgi:predicted dehydrogenase